MKRIIATLLLIFISSLILNNFFAGFNRAKKILIFNETYLNNNKDTLNTKDTCIDSLNQNKKDTILSRLDVLKVSKPKNFKSNTHTATWYHTHNHPRVHRKHPTAAYNYAPIGTKLRVINVLSGDTTIVEVTDRMGDKKRNKIDLSHMAFGQISPHGYGKIVVTVEIMD
jgi:rare lipoprotein A (peptidoglycan hydrolase)